MKYKILLLALLTPFAAFAQTGNFFLSHFAPDRERFNSVCFDMAQDERGIFYFATQRGVLQFDGRNWDLIRTNEAVYALELAHDGTLYVAGSHGFGKIDLDERGLQVYRPIYEEEGAEYIFQIISQKENVYFLNDRNLFLNSLDGTKTIATAPENNWVSLSELFGEVFIGTEQNKVLKLVGNSMSPTELFPSDSSSIIFSERYENKYLVGTSASRIYLCGEDLIPQEIQLADSSYAHASVIVNATWVNQDMIALGTLLGGVMFINPNTGSTEEIINYNTGLPDNEIYSLVRDRNQNIWVAHAYGFTRISPFLPFRSFRYYSGLQGNLLCAINYNGNAYVGTSLGLYRLEQEEFYDEIVYFVDVPVRVSVKDPGKKITAPTTPPTDREAKPESPKGGLFNFLRKKKQDKESEPAASVHVQTTEPTRSKTQIVYQKEKRTKKILRSTHFAYKKVEGIDSKVTQLSKWKGKLIASSLSGAYEIDQNAVRPIIEGPVRFLFASENGNTIILSTYDDKVHRFTTENNEWKETGLITGIGDPIGYIFEEPGSSVWLCGLDKLYRVTHDTTQQVEELPVVNSDFEKIVGISSNNQVIAASSSGFYFYDSDKRDFTQLDTLARPLTYFAGNNKLWFKDDHAWHVVGAADEQNVQLLNLFQDIRFITSDETTGDLWIITGNNELLLFNTSQILPDETRYPLLLKSVEQDSIVLSIREMLELDQDNSSLRVEVIKPDYIGVRSVEYRYYLEGLHAEWSEWSASNNVIHFPYLPPGDYQLRVQSKDIFGRTNDMGPMRIQVFPPYWKRSWFYALEFGVFTLLVIGSFRLSNRYRFVSRVLSLVSIIILIEFIQTVAGSTFATGSSPVIEFGVQVGIAFLILPVEGFLRKVMLRSVEKRSEYNLPEAEELPEKLPETNT